MCGGGGSKKKAAPATPTYQYYPEAARTPNQEAAAIEASQASTASAFGSELTTGSGAASTSSTGMT